MNVKFMYSCCMCHELYAICCGWMKNKWFIQKLGIGAKNILCLVVSLQTTAYYVLFKSISTYYINKITQLFDVQ